MFIADHFPKLGADLVPALARLDVHDLPHGRCRLCAGGTHASDRGGDCGPAASVGDWTLRPSSTLFPSTPGRRDQWRRASPSWAAPSPPPRSCASPHLSPLLFFPGGPPCPGISDPLRLAYPGTILSGPPRPCAVPKGRTDRGQLRDLLPGESGWEMSGSLEHPSERVWGRRWDETMRTLKVERQTGRTNSLGSSPTPFCCLSCRPVP